jgi:hypothetical protein
MRSKIDSFLVWTDRLRHANLISVDDPSTKSLRDSPRHAGALADGPVTI